jgi:hypothetical protein
MPRYTSTYADFVKRLDEVRSLRKLAASIEKKNPIKKGAETNALCRGAIVLLSSHLEAYIKELGETALDSMHSKNVSRKDLTSQLYYHISKDIIDELQDASEPSSIGDKIFLLIEKDISFWSRVGPFPQPVPVARFNRGFSNPGFSKIKKYFNRFGYADYAGDMNQQMKALYQPTINAVNHLVDTRNKIAHGDPGATKTPKEIQELTSTIQKFCGVTDGVFASWWKLKFCSIR